MSGAPFQLFHELAHPPSAKVRRYIVDQALEDQVQFRNVTFDEARAALSALGGSTVPALWDGATLYEGAELILVRLGQLVDIGRSR